MGAGERAGRGRRATLPGTEPEAPSLRLRGLHKRYGSLHVLDVINLDVGHHEIVTIVGPSGCGKTTLLHIVKESLIKSSVATTVVPR